MNCLRCNNVKMKQTMHFESDRQYQFSECPKCHYKTKNKRIHFEDILAEEIVKKRTKTS